MLKLLAKYEVPLRAVGRAVARDFVEAVAPVNANHTQHRQEHPHAYAHGAVHAKGRVVVKALP